MSIPVGRDQEGLPCTGALPTGSSRGSRSLWWSMRLPTITLTYTCVSAWVSQESSMKKVTRSQWNMYLNKICIFPERSNQRSTASVVLGNLVPRPSASLPPSQWLHRPKFQSQSGPLSYCWASLQSVSTCWDYVPNQFLPMNWPSDIRVNPVWTTFPDGTGSLLVQLPSTLSTSLQRAWYGGHCSFALSPAQDRRQWTMGNEWMNESIDKMPLTSYSADLYGCGNSFLEGKTLA